LRDSPLNRLTEKKGEEKMKPKREGLKAEKWVSSLVGGLLTPASGAIHASLDIRSLKRWNKEFILEVKSTTKESFTLYNPLWRKIVARAEMRMLCPALCVVFKTRLSGRKAIVVVRREDAPTDLPIEREEVAGAIKGRIRSLHLQPIDEIILVRWGREELVIMPLYRWK
jgi:hypothetical protein